ncbi:MAG: UDP-glucose--hexose-1-phosphate uridylyltransferase [Eubacteriales bacterium]|nr:UDP-glucose--hexose-1-phosphate uridylyltransferase [Eubacteriales bacterium]
MSFPLDIQIERLFNFAVERELIQPLDRFEARNALLDLFQVEQPFHGELPLALLDEKLETATGILDTIVETAIQRGLIDGTVFPQRALFDTRIMGCLMPKPSTVAEKFSQLYQQSPDQATSYFYQLSIASNYIRTAEIARNISWQTATAFGEIEITINLTKPEKDPKQIALEKLLPQSSYPTCLLCPENVGYAGRLNFPARQTLRLVPLKLAGEHWFLQYSPYVYYNEHCIVLGERHEPMTIHRWTFEAILDFVRQFPHYFCGSNADLPIVGGSILNHNHFQGGRAKFPMDTATIRGYYEHPAYPEVVISHLHWPLTSLRLTSQSIDALVDLADQILKAWRDYSDPTVDVLAYSQIDGQIEPHNTITPIARQNRYGQYELDLVLRNNRTTEELPLGIFHPHPEIHPIKKENIGLIEVMGLAILPGRLLKELGELNENVQNEVGQIFTTGLVHCGVFKLDDPGQMALNRFLSSTGISRGGTL